MEESKERDITEEKLLEYGSYCQVAVSLQHYNRIQTTYRTFTSTWLLATFAGIGYALSSLEADLPFHPLLIVAFICLASATGVSLVWYMDLIICEQHIAALVIDGIELENKYQWLPKFYNNVNNMSSLLDYVSSKGVFYIGCFAVLFITMGASIFLYLQDKGEVFYFFVPIFTLAFIFFIGIAIVYAMKKSDPYQRLEKMKKKNVR